MKIQFPEEKVAKNPVLINLSIVLYNKWIKFLIKSEKDLIGIDENNGDRLVFLSSEVDFDESVPFSVSMLKTYCFLLYISIIYKIIEY